MDAEEEIDLFNLFFFYKLYKLIDIRKHIILELPTLLEKVVRRAGRVVVLVHDDLHAALDPGVVHQLADGESPEILRQEALRLFTPGQLQQNLSKEWGHIKLN